MCVCLCIFEELYNQLLFVQVYIIIIIIITCAQDKRCVFKQLMKANLQSARGNLFHITFMAMNAHPRSRLVTFQAEVYENFGGDKDPVL